MNTGGPAFPIPSEECAGMTLRDYFAAKAMQALINSDEWRENMSNGDATMGYDPSEFTAIAAYELADAMLEVKER